MSQDKDFEDNPEDDPFEVDEPDDDRPEIDLEQVRVFSIDDEDDDDLDLEIVETIPQKPALEDVLGDLERGERFYSDLLGFSDLSGADLTSLESRWPRIEPELRASVVREAFDLGQEDFKLQFARLFLFATRDDDPQVRQLAVAALGFEVDPSSAERLIEILRDDLSDDVRSDAAKSLGPYVMLAEFGELPESLAERLATQLFDVAEDEDESWHVRRRAAESAAAFGPNDRVNRLVQRMYDEDEMGLRASALYAAGRGNQRTWLTVAIEEFANEDAEIRFEAARSAGMFGDVDALPGLSELARSDHDVDVRHAAIAAIGEIGGAGANRILMRLSESAPESDQEVIDDAMVEAALESDPLSFGVDPDSN
jgi:HEAT repeat protein